MGPTVWQNETRDAYQAVLSVRRVGGPAYMTPEQWARLERIRQARMLYRGKHREYFLDQGRSQFDFPWQLVNGQVMRPYQRVNLLKLVSKKTTDLLFGSAPLVTVEDKYQQAAVDDLRKRTNLHRLLKNTATEASYEGEAFVEAVRWKGEVYLRRLLAESVHPEGPLMPDGQFERDVRYQEDDLGTAGAPVPVVLVTRWAAGSIERALYQLDDKGRLAGRLSLNVWPAFAAAGEAGGVPADVTPTGIDRNTITWVPNELDHDCPVSDYDGLLDLQDAVNAKSTGMSRVLGQHQDPILVLPGEATDAGGNARSRHKVYFVREGETVKPQYVTWDAQLEAAIRDRSFSVSTLLMLAEISPALLGLKEGGRAHARRKLRLEASNSLAMAQRKGIDWQAAVVRMVDVAQDLAAAGRGTGYVRGDAAVELRDGIPIDEQDEANVVATYRASGVMSVEAGVERRLGGDRPAVAKEMERLAAERAAATPSVFMETNGRGGEPGEDEAGGGGTGEDETTQIDDAADAAMEAA